jgi:hypothetical protein
MRGYIVLSYAFSLIADFTNLVAVPDAYVPKRMEDLKAYYVGVPFPVGASVTTRSGAIFWVWNGSVRGFARPDSFTSAPGPLVRSMRTGARPALTTNEASLIASNTLQRLIKGPWRLTNGPPRIRVGGYEGHPLPYYRIVWPPLTGGPHGAMLELDGVTGEVLSLSLYDRAFFDPALDEKIRREATTAEPTDAPEGGRRLSPVKALKLAQPGAKEVASCIPGWLAFCGKLGLSPGSQTNVADVDWECTFVETNRAVSTNTPIYHVQFKNGACFDSIKGVAVSHFSEDSAFVGQWFGRPAAEWAPFRGKIIKDWHELAKALEPTMTHTLGLPQAVLAACRPVQATVTAGPGATNAVKRMLVQWRVWPEHPGPSVTINETSAAVTAEFDLESGELKGISFYGQDRRTAQALADLPDSGEPPRPRRKDPRF